MMCGICYDSLFNAQDEGHISSQEYQPVALSCGHVFHRGCIQDWFQTSHRYNCPTCHQTQMGGLIILYVSIDKDSLPADDNDGKENQDALENISDCLNGMSIGSWPSLPSAKKPAADKSALERTEDLCKESACVSSKCDDLQQTELTLTGRCGRLETEIEVEKLCCAWKNVRKEDLLAKLHSSQKEYDQLGKRHDEVVKEVRELNDKYAAVKSDYKLYKAKYEQSQSNLQAAEGNIFDLREDMVAEKARAKALQRKVNQLNTMVNSLKKYIAKTC